MSVCTVSLVLVFFVFFWGGGLLSSAWLFLLVFRWMVGAICRRDWRAGRATVFVDEWTRSSCVNMSAAWAHGAGGRDGGDRGNGANGPGQADDAAAKRKKRKKKPAPYKLDAKLRKFWSAQMDEMNGLTGQ